jgi:hypothetical protein
MAQIKFISAQIKLVCAQIGFSVGRENSKSVGKSLNISISGDRMPPSKAKNPGNNSSFSGFPSKSAFLVECDQIRVTK